MHLSIDLRTVFIMGAITTSVLSLCMIVAAAQRTYAGFGAWTTAVVMFNLGGLLIGLRGFLPSVVTILAANGLILGAAILVYRGLLRFAGRRSRRFPHLLVFVLWAGPFAVFTYLRPDLRMRSALILSFTLAYWIAVMAV